MMSRPRAPATSTESGPYPRSAWRSAARPSLIASAVRPARSAATARSPTWLPWACSSFRSSSVSSACDFPACSASAFSSTLGVEDLVCLHSFRIPSNPAKLNHSAEQVEHWYRQAATVHLSGFLQKSPYASANFRAVLRQAPIPGAGIIDELQSADYDLVVLTTRGRNAVSRALLGSNTAEVIRRSAVPVLAVKVKGEGLALLKTLLGIGDQQESQATPVS